MASFWKCWVFKFQFQRKMNKEKRVESRDMWLTLLSRSMEIQVSHDRKAVVIDWFLKNLNLTTFFVNISLYLFSGNMNFVHILHAFIMRIPFKRKFLRVSNFKKLTMKFAKICTRKKLVCLRYIIKTFSIASSPKYVWHVLLYRSSYRLIFNSLNLSI